MKLEQEDIVLVLSRRILYGFAMAEHLMDRKAEGTVAAGIGARRRPVILLAKLSK